MNNWYLLNEKDRIKNVYSQFTIKDFWEWWSDKKHSVMEIRIQDIDVIKDVKNKFHLPWSYSGVYVSNAIQLKNVIGYVRDKSTIWFGINPRKKNWNKWGNKSFGSGKRGGSSDENVESLKFIFIDIDRVGSFDTEATERDLEGCNILCDKIIERLSKQGWNKSYCKICSGNGVQLLIKLDFSFQTPPLKFDNKTKHFESNDNFDKIKLMIKNGIGKQLLNFSKSFREELKVDIDKSCFNVSRVGALPFTKNYKYDSFTWRGIVEIRDGVNFGLSDYCDLHNINKQQFSKLNKFKIRDISFRDKLYPGRLMECPIIKFMLENPNLPSGGRNNILFFQLKCLLRDSKIDLNSEEWKKIHRELERKQNHMFTMNIPDKKFQFSRDIVNSYFIQNLIPPLYPVWEHKTKYLGLTKLFYNDVEIELLNNFERIYYDENDLFKLKDITTIKEDLEDYRKYLLSIKNIKNSHKTIYLSKFISGCINKYGLEETKYYFKFLFYGGINYE